MTNTATEEITYPYTIVQLGATGGPTITYGSGAPTELVQPSGSIYINTDSEGGAMYLNLGGDAEGWNEIAFD